MIPLLDNRFLEPPGWTWETFHRLDKTVRYGFIIPQNEKPTAIVVCLPGLSEFGEKYFETAQDFLKRNIGFFVIDWVGQGRSSRYLDNPHKRHTAGFKNDIDDLTIWINEHVKPQTGNTPLVMLAHSMGGHIGLHYLKTNTETFSAAAFSAPMIGIKAFQHMPLPFALNLVGIFNTFMPETYVPGGKNWQLQSRNPGHDIFSSDPIRGAIHNTWSQSEPNLQVGNITYKWLYEALKSCQSMQDPGFFETIKTPSVIALAGQEALVDNRAIKKAVAIMPDSKLLELDNAHHEILMERDSFRKQYLDSIFSLIQTTLT